MLQLYNRERSGNCYKVRLMLALLGLEYEKILVHRVGKGRNILPPGFESLNPLRQLPVLVDDGKSYWGTIAILVYLARKHGGDTWLPRDAGGEAEITQWLSLAKFFTGWAARVRCGRCGGTVRARLKKRMR